MAEKITYDDKVSLTTSPLPRANKCTAEDLNEIKTVVNANADLAEKVNTIVVTITDTNLNNYIEDGTYYFSSDYTPTNIPVGINGWLQVMTSSATSNVKQVWYRHGTINSNDYQTFVRTKTGSGWSTWQQFAMVNKKGGIELLYNQEITTGTAVTLSESLSNFRFVVFRLSGSRNYVMCPLTNWSGFRGVSSYSRIGTGGNFELLTVRGTFSGTSLTVDDAGQFQIAPNGTITQNPLKVGEVWGIR